VVVGVAFVVVEDVEDIARGVCHWTFCFSIEGTNAVADEAARAASRIESLYFVMVYYY
jgi:hypothetical protein